MLGMEILVIIGLILLLLVLWIISVQRKFAVMDGNIQNAMNQIGVSCIFVASSRGVGFPQTGHNFLLLLNNPILIPFL